MLGRRLILSAILLTACAVHADDLYVNAHGTVVATADKVWLKVNNVYFELLFDTKEAFQFGQALHNRKAHASGRLEIRVAAGQLQGFRLRVEQITRQPREGYGQFHGPAYSGQYRNGVFVSPQFGTGAIGERAREADLSRGANQ